MENGWSLFSGCSAAAAAPSTATSTTTNSGRGHHGHFTAWDINIWDLGTSSRFDWRSSTASAAPASTVPIPNHGDGTAADSLVLPSVSSSAPPPEDGVVFAQHQYPAASMYAAASGTRCHPDPHLVCLNLGKRHYFEEGDRHAAKRGRAPCYGAAAGVAVPRCQVEGCDVALVDAKEYHRRHKVCEAHSKAPKVVVLGMEQRFCQQCSR